MMQSNSSSEERHTIIKEAGQDAVRASDRDFMLSSREHGSEEGGSLSCEVPPAGTVIEHAPHLKPVRAASGDVMVAEDAFQATEFDVDCALPNIRGDSLAEPIEIESTGVSIKSERSKSQKPHKQRRWRWSFSTCMTIPFAILMFVVAATVSITLGVTTSSLVKQTQRDAHAAGLEAMHSLVSTRVAVMLYTAQLVNAMQSPRVTNLEDASAMRLACRLLDKVDPRIQLRSITAMTFTNNQYSGCMHGDPDAPSLQDLFATGTTNSIANGSWAVDPVTYNLKMPLELWEDVVPELQDANKFAATFTDLDDYFEAAARYKDSPQDPHLANSVLWRYTGIRPLMLTLTYPFDVYDTQESVEAQLPSGRAILRVRMATSKILEAAAPLGNGTARVVLITSNLYDGTPNPQVSSINWNQSISNDTSEWLASVGGEVQNSSRLSDLTDPLMRAALDKMNVLDIINSPTPAEHTFVFFHKGSPCLATVTHSLSPQGLDYVLILVNIFPGKMGPPVSSLAPVIVFIPVVFVLVIVMFYVVLRAWFTAPIRRMNQALVRSSARGKPRRVQLRTRHRQLLPISEMGLLEDVYNASMSQLRKVDSFLPPTALTFILKEDDDESTSESASSGCDEDALKRDASPPPLASADTSTAMHRTIVGMSSLVCTGVSMFPSVRAYERHSLTSLAADVAYASLNLPIALTQLASSPPTSAYLPLPEDREQCVHPFESEAQLSAFFENVSDLAKHFNGQFCTMSPDITELFFAEAAMRAVDNGASREAMDQAIYEDAVSATLFCLNFQHWLDTCMADFPRMTCVVDTEKYTAIVRHLPGVELNTFTLVGRHIYGTIGCRLSKLGARVLLSEQTAILVQERVRSIPIQPLTVTPRTMAPFNVVLYEALEGDVNDARWAGFAVPFQNAFKAMLSGRYTTSTEIFASLRSQATTRPEWRLLYSAVLRALQASTSCNSPHHAVSLPPNLKLGNTYFSRSYQLDRLDIISTAMSHDNLTNPFVWFPLRQTYRFAGLEARPPLPVRLQIISSGAVTLPKWELSNAVPFVSRRWKRPLRRTSLLRTWHEDSILSRTISRYSGRLKGKSTDQSALLLAEDRLPRATSSAVTFSASQGANSSTASTQRPVAALQDRRLGLLSFRDNFDVEWIVPQVTPEGLSLFEHFRLMDANALGSNGSLAMITCFKADPTASEALAKFLFEDLFARVPYSSRVETTVGYHLFLDADGAPDCIFAVGDFSSSGNLRSLLQRYGRILPFTAIMQCFVDVVRGVLEMHKLNFVHGYIQPEHILIGTDGRCKIRAYFTSERAGRLLVVPPSTCYLSPEVIHGVSIPTTLSDSFGCGLVLAEMLTGSLPWKWSPRATLHHSESELTAVLAAGGPQFVESVQQGDIVMALDVTTTTATAAMADSNGSAADAPISVLLAKRESVYPSDPQNTITPLLYAEAFKLTAGCLRESPEERLPLSAALSRAEEILAHCVR